MKRACMLYVALGLCAVRGWSQSANTDRSRENQKLIFFDLSKLDYWDNLELAQGEPKWVAEASYTDPEHPWHKIAKSEGMKRYLSEAVTLVSKDGLHWHVRTGDHWNWGQAGWFPEPPVFAFWNARTQHHVMTVRPGWGDRRQCLRTTMDMRSWSDPELLFQPDALDTASPIGMYALPVLSLDGGTGFVGLLWIFHNSSSEPVNSFNQFFGTMDVELAFSYDGCRFSRTLRKPFLKRSAQPEFGCSQIRPCSIVETESEIRIYSEGHCAEHGREGSAQRQSFEPLCAMIVHTLRKDGWMYLRSRGDWARFQTKPFTLFKPTIRVNLSARYGEVLFQLTDEKSQPLEGFSFDDCIPVRQVDVLDHELAWGEADLHSVINQVLRLEVKFRNVNIYSFVMDHHFLDAMDQWLLKDSKPIDTHLLDY